ncbi:MAG: DegT/DnrJ/EryC1/StrS family aminotransferase [Pseudomonadota bacterium]
MMKVPFFRHNLSAEDGHRMAAVLTGSHLTYGPIAKGVEAQLCDFFGAGYAAATSSWSTGALALFHALGIGPGDEVIVPAMTFVASANIPLLCGAKVRLVDVDPDTLLVTPETVADAITPDTRAIFCVHLYGQMCDMIGLRRLADAHGVHLIEDCAHAFESQRAGIVPAMVSDAAIFSFYATKNICCGEGGAVVTRNSHLHEKICTFRQHGMSANAAERFQRQQYQHWDVEEPGMKGSLPDLLAALLGPQIETCLSVLDRRRAIADRYRAAFAEMGLGMPTKLADGRHAEHLFPVHVGSAKRDAFLASINEAGVGATVNYRALQTLSLFSSDNTQAPVARDWGEGTLSLPLFPGLTEREQSYVIDTVAQALEQTQPLACSA